MKIIAFSYTTPALLAGRKTRTRRYWKSTHTRKFKPGDRCQAYDHGPRNGGKAVAIIGITEIPCLDRTSFMTEEDYELEGFAYMEEQGLTIGGRPPREYFEAWKLADDFVIKVDFNLLEALDPNGRPQAPNISEERSNHATIRDRRW